MLRRPRRGGLGLRGRIVGAVLVTTVATLAVAAFTLLGNLEQELRHKALTNLEAMVNKKEQAKFKTYDSSLLLLLAVPGGKFPLTVPSGKMPGNRDTETNSDYAEAMIEGRRLGVQLVQLAAKVGVPGSLVNLLEYPRNSAHGHLLVQPHRTVVAQQPDSGATSAGGFGDADDAALSGRPVNGFVTVNGTEYASVAVPVPIPAPNQVFVLVVRKPIDDIPIAVHVVRDAFLYAAGAGLLLTIILGIPLAATLVRRLLRLRQAALRLAHAGPGAVDLPIDRARDEVGDLGRAFVIMERRLQQQEQARRAFVATASHELRTPLTSLEGMLELLDEDLQEQSPDLDDARALLKRARAQSRRLGRLAGDLLDLSRIDADVKLRSEPVSLGELSRAVMAEFELGTSDRGLRLTLEDDSRGVWATADPGSVARILRILLENAVRITPPGRGVRVSIRNGRHAVLSVSDEGPGVAAEERELIFQRFQRGRETGGQAGFGLGLAIGRELAGRMSGRLVLDEDAGPGATFTLTLPAARAPKSDPIGVA